MKFKIQGESGTFIIPDHVAKKAVTTFHPLDAVSEIRRSLASHKINHEQAVKIVTFLRNNFEISMENPKRISGDLVLKQGTVSFTPMNSSLTEDQMREEWKAAGGSTYGPNIEHVIMPEKDYFKFRRSI